MEKRPVKGMKWKLHPLFVLLLVASAWTPYFREILLLFGTVLLHELGHVTAALFYGYRVKELELLPFGGVARLEHGSMGWRPRHETIIAIAGPFVNFLLLMLAISLHGSDLLPDEVAADLIEINLSLAFFNLLPALPLDGGRILRAAYARSLGFQRATGVAIGMAFLLSTVLMAAGLLALLAGFVQVGMVTLGVFLFVSAWQLRRQMYYDTVRFLDTKRRQRFDRPLPVRSLAAAADTPLMQVLTQFAPDAYHVVYVRDEKRQTLRILIEEELLDAAMKPGGVRMPLGRLFAEP
ncbi:M50 family metallopeptidase [Effusibacillus pohliae]|uniref:M50 family metallopeptidase n=1 Tax=Effusibacillus pohliae TaxID=232270 RepID=UPI0003A64DA0|nr:M50 family metallopeptidase [Effusibacillus pohliae]